MPILPSILKNVFSVSKCENFADYVRENLPNFSFDETGNIFFDSNSKVVLQSNYDLPHNQKYNQTPLMLGDYLIGSAGLVKACQLAVIKTLCDVDNDISALFTSGKNSGLIGASNIDKNLFRGATMLSLCGGYGVHTKLPSVRTLKFSFDGNMVFCDNTPQTYTVKITSSKNAIKLIANFLSKLDEVVMVNKFAYKFEMDGVPQVAECTFSVYQNAGYVKKLLKLFCKACKKLDKFCSVKCVHELSSSLYVKEGQVAINFLANINSGKIDGVEQNISGVNFAGGEVYVSVFSNDENQLENQVKTLLSLAEEKNIRGIVLQEIDGIHEEIGTEIPEMPSEIKKMTENNDDIYAVTEGGTLKKRNKNLKVVAIDFFHFKRQGKEYVKMSSLVNTYLAIKNYIDKL